MKRLFAAIKIFPEPGLLKTYGEIKKLLYGEKITWVDERNIHITLKFFGDTPEENIPQITDLFDLIAARHLSFSINLENTGIFGSSYNPRVIWFGITHSRPVELLAEDVLSTLNNNGYPNDNQHFRPHLTIGRVKYLSDKRYFQQVVDRFKTISLQKVMVSNFELMESRLTPRGPVYSTLRVFKLG